MNRCSFCLRTIEGDDAPILTISGFGKPRLLCPHCDKLVGTICDSTDKVEVSEAIEKIGESLTLANVDDKAVFDTLKAMIDEARVRIEEGVLPITDAPDEQGDAVAEDNEADTLVKNTEAAAEEIFDIPEELRESDEDRAKDEKEAKHSKVMDSVVGWAAAAILVATIVIFIVKFII